ncbi:MAG: hypothetical protein ACRDQZ_24400, partial [Mycobacteriales bacterium]
EDDAGGATVVREVFAVDRDALAADTLGLHLSEAQDLLAAVQDTMVAHQVSAALSAQVGCPDCGVPRRHKDSRPIVMRTLFGTLRVESPRWWHCGCLPQTNRTFSPLGWILPERLPWPSPFTAGLGTPSSPPTGRVIYRRGRLHFTLRTAQLHAPKIGALDAGLRPRPFPDDTASLLPGHLAATRTGLSPASDDELTKRKINHLHDRPPFSAGRTSD